MKLKEKLVRFLTGASRFAVFPAVLAVCLLLFPMTAHADDPPASLRDLEKELLSFFTPATGMISEVAGERVTIDTGESTGIRKGMRFFAYQEGAPFLHPVTKEPLGKIEVPLGQVEISDVAPGRASARIVSGTPESLKGAKVKIQQFKVKVLFYQGNTDWYVGDAYYQILKNNARVELIDTSLDIRDMAEVGAEGKKKGADVVLMLGALDADDHLVIDQRLFWSTDMRQFSEKRASVPPAALKELRYRSASFGPKEGEALLLYAVPAGVKFLAAGDFDGNGETEIVLVSGSNVRSFRMAVDLVPLAEFSVPEVREILWIETFTPPGSRRDLLLITGKSDDPSDQIAERPRAPVSTVTSFVYEYGASGFVRLAKFDFAFTRQMGGHVIIQEYSLRSIYEGPVVRMSFDGKTFTPAEQLKLPPGAGIYDFQYLRSPEGVLGTLVWTENGFLAMYNDQGVRIWMSREDYGGFPQTFARRAPTIMTETERWSVKDKLLDFRGEVMAPKRTPLLRNARALGYSKSELRSLWWSGMGVEERRFIGDIDGSVLDYAIVGDRIAVLSKPLFGVKAGNILKGDNPFVSLLSIYAIKGK